MNLKKHLQNSKITTYRMAKELDIAYSTADSWVKNPKQIKLDNLYKIADMLGVDISELFFDDYHQEQLRINGVVGQSEQLFCGHCGSKKQLKVETDLNSDRVCKSQLCAK